MRLSERALRFRLYLLLRTRSRMYQGYSKRIEEMASGDPLTMSADRLAGLLSFVSERNGYYGEMLSGGGLGSLPILTKETIRRRYQDLLTSPQPAGAFRNSSGGSTGRPVTLVQDANYASWLNATQGYYFREFLGVEMNAVRNVWLWGSDRESLGLRELRVRGAVARFLKSQLFLNTFNVSEEGWLEYAERIRRYRPHYVVGYAGSLYEMARAARRRNVRLHRPAFVYSSAEMLRDFMRAEIQEQFGAPVYDFYGSREVGPVAGECASGSAHVFVMNNVVEVVDDKGRPMEDGAEGRLVVTNLHNRALPMIRYEIGDTGAMSPDSCGCGSALPVLERLTGRITDHFILREGALVHGEFVTHLFYYREWVDRFQVDQLEHDRLRIRVVTRGAVDEDDVAEIEHGVRLVMGSGCRLEWEYVDSIEKSPQGKHLFTRCLLPDRAG